MLFNKQLIEECSTSTRQLIRTICTQTQEHQAEEVATNLLLTAYLIILADNDLRPQDTSRKEDYKVIQTLINVISKKVHQLKASLDEGTPEQSNNTEAPKSPPPERIQYGVKLALQTGSEFTPSLRWRDWNDAAKHGEDELKAKRATGFWVFREAT